MASAKELDDFLAGVERRAYKSALLALQDHHSALDVVQNAMLKLCERYGERPSDELPLIFQRILQNAITDHFRRAKVRNFWTTLLSPFKDADGETPGDSLETLPGAVDTRPGADPAGMAESSQQIAAIEQALAELPARQRQAFLLRYWEGMDIAETAKAMACSEGSVKTHCFRAINALSVKLKGKGIRL